MIDFTILFFKFIDDYKLIETDVYKRAEIDRKLFSKIRCGQVPGKKTIIKLCLSIGLTLEESELLLMKAGYALSDCIEFDIKAVDAIKNKDINFIYEEEI